MNYGYTHLENAKRFVKLFGNKVRFVKDVGWFILEDGVWIRTIGGIFQLYTTAIIPSIYEEARFHKIKGNKSKFRRLSEWGEKSESISNINSSIKCIQNVDTIFFEDFNDLILKEPKPKHQDSDKFFIIKRFIEEQCLIDKTARESFSELYSNYCNWCELNIKLFLGKRLFGESLISLGYKRVRNKAGIRCYSGLFLK